MDAAKRIPTDLSGAEDAFRWLGLELIAALLASVRRDIAAGVLDDDERAGALERDADERYSAILPSDAALKTAFRRRLEEEPSAFA